MWDEWQRVEQGALSGTSEHQSYEHSAASASMHPVRRRSKHCRLTGCTDALAAHAASKWMAWHQNDLPPAAHTLHCSDETVKWCRCTWYIMQTHGGSSAKLLDSMSKKMKKAYTSSSLIRDRILGATVSAQDSLTSVGLHHLGATNKADVACPTVLGARVTGCQTSIEVILSGSFITIDGEVTTGTVHTAHPDLDDNTVSLDYHWRFNANISHIHHSNTKIMHFKW